MDMLFIWKYFVLTVLIINISGQLVVNVKNNGGDVYTENIEANTTQDSINLQFRMADGTVVTQFIDGRNEVHIFKVVILPEEERGQTHIQTLCFVLRFAKNEFIASDAMSKLRQKNPSAVRHPEEQRPVETHQLDLQLDVHLAHAISPHITRLCADARDTTFMKLNDIKLLSQILNRDYTVLESASHPIAISSIPLCVDSIDSSRDLCMCRYNICIGWYPCGLKYCRGKDSAGRVVSYRCGIKTCSKCREFDFRVMSKNQCIWDEVIFTLPEEDTSQKFDLAMEDGGEEEDRVVPPNILPGDVDQIASIDDDGKSRDIQNKQLDLIEMKMKKKSLDNNSSKGSKDVEVVVDKPILPPEDEKKSSAASLLLSYVNKSVSSTGNDTQRQQYQIAGNKIFSKNGVVNDPKVERDSAGDNILDDDEDGE